MSDTRYNLPIDTWERAVAELTDVLVPVARRGTTVTYSEAVSNLSTVHLTGDSTAFHVLLGDVSRASFDAGAPLLSAVVVAKDSGQPGGGFYDLARELGFDVPDEPAAESMFWGAHLDEVHRWWPQKIVGAPMTLVGSGQRRTTRPRRRRDVARRDR